MTQSERIGKQSTHVGPLESLSITDRELFERLGWFTQVRWVFGFFCLMVLLVSRHGFGVNFRTPDGELTTLPAVIVVGIIFLYNALFVFLTHILKTRRVPTHRIIVGMTLAQIAADLIAVAALAHNTGGVENWYIILVLVPVAIAAELLPQTLAYATAAGAAALLNTLAWFEQQGVLPHVRVHLADQGPALAHRYAEALYVFHVTGALTVAIFAVTYVGATIAARLRQRERQLGDAYRLLHEADETKSFFMRKASHEMRAPLGAIDSMLSTIAMMSDNLDAEQQRMFRRVQHRTRGLIGLVKDLHRYSLLRSAEGNPMHRDQVRLEELVANTCELFQERARDGAVVLSCHTSVVSVTGDEELLREMVTTLIANAVQYTPENGRIDVSLSDVGGEAVLRVADTGIGISEKAREHVFEEFYRAAEAKEVFTEGTGLGLAIAKRVVEMHAGTIDVAARSPRGSVFTVTMPAAGGRNVE